MPTFVAPSQIAGVGVFAATRLAAGTVVWEYDEGVDWRISAEELSLFPEPYLSRLRHWLYREESGMYVLCGDNAKFMNHADVPNCDDSGLVQTIVLRPIRAGEELTCDYRLFDAEVKANGVSFGEADLTPVARRAHGR